MPTRPRNTCLSTSILLRRSWSFINPGEATRTSADSPPPTRFSSCWGFAYCTLSRFLVSLRYCSATFTRPGATAAALRTLISSAAAEAGRAHTSARAMSLTFSISRWTLFDARGSEERLALAAPEIPHKGARELGARGGGHGRRRVRGVVLHIRRE